MDLLDKTRIVIELLTGADAKDLTAARELDPGEGEGWLRAFLEAGIAALAAAEAVGGESAALCPIIPLPLTTTAEGKDGRRGRVER